MRLLIVDDNAQVRRFLRVQLTEVCTQIAEAGSGEAALNLYRSFHPDAVIMDLHLPGMNGLETTACLRSLDQQAHIVVLSEYGDVHLRQHAQLAGAAEYFLKEDLKLLKVYMGLFSRSLSASTIAPH